MTDFAEVLQPKIVLGSWLTGGFDVNRNTRWEADDFGVVADWATSVRAQGRQAVLFHNGFSAATVAQQRNDFLIFVKIEGDSPLNSNVRRYCIYQDFLAKIKEKGVILTDLFLTDVADVVLLNDPFSQPFYLKNPDAIFCGDEPKTLENDWMREHSAHLRSKIADFEAFERQFAQATLLNCGIIGGKADLIHDFLRQLCALHQGYNADNATAYTGDMGAFNYLVRTKFQDNIRFGAPINTVFKGYETQRTDCWFRHK